MPWKPKTPCRYPGCKELSHSRFCELHHKQEEKAHNKIGNKFYTRQWENSRKHYLQANPLCIECEKNGKVTQATEVDHIIPHRGNKQRFWDVGNWQALCKSCHSRKTVYEDGGFGHTPKRKEEDSSDNYREPRFV